MLNETKECRNRSKYWENLYLVYDKVTSHISRDDGQLINDVDTYKKGKNLNSFLMLSMKEILDEYNV